jgi:protease-4
MVWEEVRLLEEADKPVVVSMSSVAGSGGYYIAMPARCLVAQPSTITGSIGVYFGKFDLSGLYRWLGMRVEQVKLSPSADILSMFDSLDPDQKRQVESWVGSTYDTFVAKAAQGRGMTVEQMEPKARGRIYTGAQAKKAGLVDDIGGLGVAMERMRGFLKLKKDETLELVLYPRPKTLWESLSSGDFLPVQQHPPRLREWLEAEGKDLSTPAPWAIMPEVQIR